MAQSVHPALVSFNSAGTATGNRSSGEPGTYSVSADGRYVAFTSDASDLVPNDSNASTDVYVRDMATGVTRLVSATPGGASGNRTSGAAIISGNGRYVAFTSFADNLVPNDTNSSPDAYVRDLQTNTTTLVSIDRTNTKSGFGPSDPFAITPDGRYVLFGSGATDLVDVPPISAPVSEVFVRDMQAGTTRLVSINKTGTAWANFSAFPAAITPDGRYVTFNSTATDITDDDPANQGDVFVRDMQAGTTRLVSVAVTGTSGNGSSSGGAMSDDGRYVFFASTAANLTATPDANTRADYFVRDTQAGTTTLISVNRAGTAAGRNTQNPNGFSPGFSVTPDGRYIAFASQSDDLVDNDQNGSNDDVFVRDMQAGTTRLVSVGLSGRSGNFGGRLPSISADGRYVAFESFATDLVNVPDFVGGLTADVFVRDLQAGVTVLGSINVDGTATPNDSAFAPRISADGRRVVFHSRASNIVPNDTNGPDGHDVFAFDPVFPPTSHLQFSEAAYTVGEGDAQALVTVTRTDGSLGAVSVNYATSDGTARAGSDYAATSGTLTFADGDTAPKTFAVPIVNDSLSEASETINLSFSAPTGGAAVGTPPLAVLTIIDNDPQPALRVSNVSVPEGGAGVIGAVFRVSLSAPSGATVTANYATADATATSGTDYEAASGALTFSPGETSKTVSVNVFGDTVVEPDETFTLNLSNTVGATTAGAGGTGTITNDDPGTQFNVSGAVSDPSAGGVGGVTITLQLEPAGTTLVTQTDANGNYAFTNLPLGQSRATVTPSKAGLNFSPQSSGLVTSSSLGGSNTVNFVAGTVYIAALTGAQVVPPTNSNGLGFGVLTLSLDETKASVDLNFGGLSGSQTQAHIHSSSGPGANGPILFTLPRGVVSNFLITLTPAQVQLLKAGQLYFDVHTNLFSGGEIRGQLTPLPSQTLQFGAASYNVAEQDGHATLTVTRSGDLSAPASVSYQTVDNLAAIRCDDTTSLPGVAFARCDYATTVGTLAFAPGVAQMTISVPVVDDAHAEGSETIQVQLSNAQGATLGATSTATLTITDNDAPNLPASANPIVSRDYSFFVRMQYLDFFGREPDADGFAAWKATLDNCPDPFNTLATSPSANCDRVSVSTKFFRSKEFEAKGGYVFNFYRVAFARLPHYSEIIPDMASLTAVDDAGFFAKKAAFTGSFVQRQEFRNLYDALSNQQYVDALMGRYNLQQITTPNPSTPDDASNKITLTRADLAGRLNGATLTRAQALRAVADSNEVRAAEANSSFVAMQYFGYLRRDPEEGGYNDWLRTINANPADIRSMVNGFMNSTEYRLRFGTP
jgi:hypothetical protein